MATLFSYSDYLLYSANKDVNDVLYTSIISGVLQSLRSEYGLQILEDTSDVVIYGEGTQIHLDIAPIVSINSVSYDGVLLEASAWTYFNNTLKFTSLSIVDTKELKLNITVGYAEVPADLKLAIYMNIDSVAYKVKHNTADVGATTNSTGNTTKYDGTGSSIYTNTYRLYSKQLQVLF